MCATLYCPWPASSTWVSSTRVHNTSASKERRPGAARSSPSTSFFDINKQSLSAARRVEFRRSKWRSAPPLAVTAASIAAVDTPGPRHKVRRKFVICPAALFTTAASSASDARCKDAPCERSTLVHINGWQTAARQPRDTAAERRRSPGARRDRMSKTHRRGRGASAACAASGRTATRALRPPRVSIEVAWLVWVKRRSHVQTIALSMYRKTQSVLFLDQRNESLNGSKDDDDAELFC